MKKLNLILSAASTVVTLGLLIATMFAWYVTNQEAEAHGVIANTADNGLATSLRYWDGDSWEDVEDDLNFEGWLPGTTTYFELVIENSAEADLTINANFIGIESKVDNNYVKATYDDTKGGFITYNGVDAYKFTGKPSGSTASYVRVDTIDASNQALYKITQGQSGYVVSAETLKIENGFKWQYIGESEEDPNETLHTGAVTDIDDITEDDYIYDITDPLLTDYDVYGGTTLYYYFAVTFMDDDDMDQFYMYQELFIEAISIQS
jgi:hypothetical protein